MMNAVFEKSMENVRKRRRIKLTLYPREAVKYISSNCFKSFHLFSQDLAAIELFKMQVCLEKPIYVGLSILDLSKFYMYSFHYGQVMSKYNNTELLFTDTDSFCYQIYTDDLYMDYKKDVNGVNGLICLIIPVHTFAIMMISKKWLANSRTKLQAFPFNLLSDYRPNATLSNLMTYYKIPIWSKWWKEWKRG